MSKRRRGRITVQNQPTGAARGMMRGMGVVHAIFGGVFVLIALTEIMPQAGIIGLPFLAGGEKQTTNNRMELTGVIQALKALKEPCVVELYSDTKYVIDALEKGWAKGWKARGWVKSDKKPALNPDLWEELLRLTELHQMSYEWVKGHAVNEYNNRCDEMAVEESRKFR